MEQIYRNYAMAARRVRRQPLPFILMVVTLICGIGATGAALTVVHSTLLGSPNIADIERVVNIYNRRGGPLTYVALSWGDFIDLERRQQSFDVVAGWVRFSETLGGGRAPVSIMGEIVSRDYFTLVGATPSLGRLLVRADYEAGSPVVVLGYSLWKRQFGGDPAIVNSTVRLNNVPFTVVGVMSRSFRGVDMATIRGTDAWVPIPAARFLRRSNLIVLDPAQRERRWILAKGRLRANRSVADAVADVTRIGGELDAQYPLPAADGPASRRNWYTVPASTIHVHESVSDQMVPIAWLAMAILVSAWLGACTNVANLAFAAGGARQAEYALRTAVGATRRRLIAEQLVDISLVALVGSAGALIAAYVIVNSVGSILTFDITAGLRLDIDPRFTLASSLGVLLLTSLSLVVCGVWPARAAARMDAWRLLTTGQSVSRSQFKVRRNLIASQVAISTLLIGLTALMTHQILAQAFRDTGVDLDDIAIVEMDLDQLPSGADGVVPRLVAGSRQLPGIEAVGLSTSLPIASDAPMGEVQLPGAANQSVAILGASPGTLRLMGLDLVYGRDFAATDTSSKPVPVILGESTAVALFGRPNIVGSLLRVRVPSRAGGSPTQMDDAVVVGVSSSSDVRGVGRRDLGIVYYNLGPPYAGRLMLLARSMRDPGVAAGTIQSLARRAGVTTVGSGTARARVDPDSTLRLVAKVTGSLGMATIGLAMIGLGGLQAFAVSLRQREIGVRQALGATPRHVLGMLMKDGMKPVIEGLAIGLGVLGLSHLLLRPFFSAFIPKAELWALVLVPLVTLGCAACAAYLPARATVRANPSDRLRQP